MPLWIGTSGFQYPEWKGNFYPETLAKEKMLAYYADRFSSTESNYTFRSLPSARTIERWSASTPDAFRFSVKAPQKITHFAKLRECAPTLHHFHGVVSGLGAKLGAVLFQLPPSLQRDLALLSSFLRDLPAGLRAAFEFRHASWFTDEVFTELRRYNAALCVAESDDLATPAVATADFSYLRLRREGYTDEDLQRWAEFAQSLITPATDLFIYFKHEETGTGPKFAARMQEILAA